MMFTAASAARYPGEPSDAEIRGIMLAHKESAARVGGSKGYGIDDVLRDSHRYSEEIRQRDREDQRRGWLWFSLLVFTVGSIVGFWAWISQ